MSTKLTKLTKHIFHPKDCKTKNPLEEIFKLECDSNYFEQLVVACYENALNITKDNVLAYLDIARNYDFSMIVDKCCEFIGLNMDETWCRSVLELSARKVLMIMKIVKLHSKRELEFLGLWGKLDYISSFGKMKQTHVSFLSLEKMP